VQIQNATGCVLNVQTGIGNFTIQGLAASTIPTDNQLPVTLNPVAGYTNFSEYVKIIWLLDGQTAPMQDGSINAPYVPGTPQTGTVFLSLAAPGPASANGVVIASPAPGGSYYLPDSITILSQQTSTLSGLVAGNNPLCLYDTVSDIFIQVRGSPLNLVAGVLYVAYFVNPAPTTDSFDVYLSGNTVSETITLAEVSFNYFVVAG
jgi:hypothetical protein